MTAEKDVTGDLLTKHKHGAPLSEIFYRIELMPNKAGLDWDRLYTELRKQHPHADIINAKKKAQGQRKLSELVARATYF